MTFARPLLLVAFLALPVLWLLARRASSRRDLPVGSLLIWRRIGLRPEAPTRVRRHRDRLLWLRMAVAAAVALGLAGPVARSLPSTPVLHVLLDASPSMAACSRNAANALERIESHLGDTARIRVHRRDGIGDLPAVLATAGAGDVVVVTDHRPEGFESGGRVHLLLVGEPVQNVGFTGLWVTEGHRYTAIVRNFGTVEREVAVLAAGERSVVTIAPGAAERVSGDASGGEVELTLSPGDRFPFDDTAFASRGIRRSVALRWVGPEAPRMALALSVAGVTIGDAADSIGYRTAPADGMRLVVAPPGPAREVEGALVAGPMLAPESVPPAGIPLGRASVLAPGGVVLLADRTGPLAVVRGERIEVALDPEDPASGWTRDPSFPIFFAEVARRLGAGEADVTSGRSFRESSTRPESAPFRLDGITPSPSPPPPERRFSWLLFLLAAVLLALHIGLEVRGEPGRGPSG